MSKIRVLFLITCWTASLVTGIFTCGDIYAQISPVSDEPIHIEADRMVSNQKDNAVVFTGNVQANQGPLTINSDEMTVYYIKQTADAEQQKAKQEINKIFAKGRVEIIQGELVATGDQVEFMADKRQVLLTGNTKVWQNNNLVTGEKVLLDLKTETTVIEPDKESGGRVKAFFYPESPKK